MTETQEPALRVPKRLRRVRPRHRAFAGEPRASKPGLIHAVVGQNGAGKTTFARVAAGLIRPQSGEVLVQGKPDRCGQREGRARRRRRTRPSELRPAAELHGRRGDGVRRTGQPRRSSRAASSSDDGSSHLASLDVSVDSRRRIRDLPVETQQGVEIARALVTEARVLILDEPTAVLSPSGAERLFDRIRTLKARGVTVILILHKIREVLAIADTVTVLRGGRLDGGDDAGRSRRMPLRSSTRSSARQARIRSTPADAKALVGAESGGGRAGPRRGQRPLAMLELRQCRDARRRGRTRAARRLARHPPRRDRRHRRRRRQRPAHAGESHRRAGRRRRRAKSTSTARRSTGSRTWRPPRPGTAHHSVRAQHRGPQPFERAVGELVGAPASALAALPVHQSAPHPARQRRRPQGLGRAICINRTESGFALRRKRPEGDPRARDRRRGAADHRRPTDARARHRRDRLRLARRCAPRATAGAPSCWSPRISTNCSTSATGSW